MPIPPSHATAGRLARRAGILALACAGLGPARAAGQDEAAVRRLVEEIRAGTPTVTVDGRDEEWSVVPAIADSLGDASRPGGDIVAISLLPTDSVLLLRLATAGPPDRADRVFWFDLDLVGSRHTDVQVGLASHGAHYVRLFDEAGRPRALRRTRAAAAVDRVVELALPVATLSEWLGEAAPLTGDGARPWVRAVAFTYDRTTRTVDDRASAASYRISGTLGDLDGPREENRQDAVATTLPLEGQWLVSQGPDGYATHAGSRAWDFTRVGPDLEAAVPAGSCRNADHLAWDAPVRAPGRARVLSTVDGSPDVSPCGSYGNQEPNEVVLALEGGALLRLAHLRRGSIASTRGERLGRGALLGRVGSSGRSLSPHLHVEVSPPGRAEPGTLVLERVRVSLNPGPDDPWARVVERWTPRPGLLVEALPPG